ncbi:hypothetical protein V8C86DRAFT_2585664, partial [Haematococcus lacustris]
MLTLTYPDAGFATPLTYSPPFLPPSLPSSLQCRSRRFHTLVTAAKRTDAENEARFAATKLLYTEEDYNSQQQSVQRAQWATAVRAATGDRHHLFWEPQLDPPALLAHVCVVLVSPRRPVSVGTVSRACSCFECEDIRIVQPRCDHITRQSKSASKGAQYIMHRATNWDSLALATADCDLRIAFTRV